MRNVFLGLTVITIAGVMFFLPKAQGQADTAKFYNTNCALCHAENGSGESPAGKALHAKDLRSAEVQAQSDAALTEIINKGKGKMPAFAAKVKPADTTKLVAYVRELAKAK